MDSAGRHDLRNIILVFACLLIASCSGLKKRSETSTSATHSSGSSIADKPEKSPKPVSVNPGDIELTDKMQAAMDNYVFKDEKNEFANLCKDIRFDCTLDGKRFPKGKKKIRRKIPPFMSGSKTGVVGDQRVLLKYNFYP